MTIVDALKKLYWKLGGTDKCDVSTSVDMLKKIYFKLGGTDKCDTSTPAEMVEKLADVAQGGGGSSDFTTATITFSTDSGVATDLPIYGAFVDDNATSPFVYDPIGPADIILYKGHAFISPNIGLEISDTSGDIEFDDSYNMWHIWGDCAVTYAPAIG